MFVARHDHGVDEISPADFRGLCVVEHNGGAASEAKSPACDVLRRRCTPIVGSSDADDEEISMLDRLPDPGVTPEAAFAHALLVEELDAALDDLPEEQRSVFIAHEFDGRSFRELSSETGIGISTLFSRKRYAVLSLRLRLQVICKKI